MKEKDQDQSQKGNLPEALRPEIGNGAAWEADPHFLNLRKVDPLADLDHKLLDGPQRDDIIRQWNSDLAPLPVPGSEGESLEEKVPEHTEEASRDKVRKERKILASTRDKGQKPDWFESIEDELVLKEDPNKPVETDTDTLHASRQEETKPVPEGKRVIKAVKKARKKQKTQKKEARSRQIEQGDGSGLSPYTKWLKSLRGSEYVHPYEDDYALAGLSGPNKEGISETFADLLALQGFKDRAVDMYKLLMSKYPEKSSFFAAKIEALK